MFRTSDYLHGRLDVGISVESHGILGIDLDQSDLLPVVLEEVAELFTLQ